MLALYPKNGWSTNGKRSRRDSLDISSHRLRIEVSGGGFVFKTSQRLRKKSGPIMVRFSLKRPFFFRIFFGRGGGTLFLLKWLERHHTQSFKKIGKSRNQTTEDHKESRFVFSSPKWVFLPKTREALVRLQDWYGLRIPTRILGFSKRLKIGPFLTHQN